MNGLQVFFYGEREVRTIQRDSVPWFAGKDVCAVFGDTNHNRSLSRVADEDKTVVAVSTPAGVRNVIFISESGLYDLLFNMQPGEYRLAGGGCPVCDHLCAHAFSMIHYTMYYQETAVATAEIIRKISDHRKELEA